MFHLVRNCSICSTHPYSLLYLLFSPLFTQVHPCSLLDIVLQSSYLLFNLGQSCPLLFTLVHSVHSPDPTCSLLFIFVPFLSILFILVHSRSLQFITITCFTAVHSSSLYGMFHVTWTTFKFNRNQLGTVSAYVMISVPWSSQRAH